MFPNFIHLVESGETVARLVSEEEVVQVQKTEGQIFKDKLMEWREKNKDWLGDKDVEDAFNIPRLQQLQLQTI